MTRAFDVLVVGGGHGGAQAALSLRQLGFSGSIAIACGEAHAPYERPPLSKEYLLGARPAERMQIRAAKVWDERQVELLLGTPIVAIDPVRKHARTQHGEEIGYGTLVWAAGGEARPLTCPGADAEGVYTVRTLDDVGRMLAHLPGVRHVAIIGGGFIGLEAAAALVKLGRSVTLFEAADRVMARVCCEEMSRFVEGEHRAHGVDLRLGTALSDIITEGGRVHGVRTTGGAVVEAQMVIVGIGIVPSIAPLREAGAACSNGVDVDAYCRTSLPDILAIGDCALHENPFADHQRVRLESVQNAMDMAATAAATITGRLEPYAKQPRFWSVQYDLNLQMAGLSIGYDAVTLRGDPTTRSFSALYFKRGRLIGIDCVNAPKDFAQGRLLIGTTPDDRTALADPATALKAVA